MSVPTTTSSAGNGVVAVAALDDVPPGWVLTVEVQGLRIAIANADGEIHAFDAVCGHAGGPLGDARLRDGCLITCPWHEAVFDVRDGEVQRGPARKPQRTYPTEIVDGTVHVELS